MSFICLITLLHQRVLQLFVINLFYHYALPHCVITLNRHFGNHFMKSICVITSLITLVHHLRSLMLVNFLCHHFVSSFCNVISCHHFVSSTLVINLCHHVVSSFLSSLCVINLCHYFVSSISVIILCY